ncbi:MAG TPA: GTP cyclohydrolase I [Candidatus Limnocylindrales bacterium]|nr:GTP cyclohydrolase I [Candidatus Limnocylindrales bacterium]
MTLSVARPAFQEAPPSAQIVHGPFTFVAHCERHGMPFFGKAYIGYVPTSERIGPSALRQMVKQAARHGEGSIESQIASMLQVVVHPAGVASAIKTSHDCAGPRLIDDIGERRATSWFGRYKADRALRSEFLSLCGPE